jgi:hypothetical protein
MFRIRNLVGLGIAVVMLILMTSWASAQPAQQGTDPCGNHAPAVTATLVPTQMATAVAPASRLPRHRHTRHATYNGRQR